MVVSAGWRTPVLQQSSDVCMRTCNAQVTQWRGCYDDICEYRRIEVTSNSPEFAEKKRESVVTWQKIFLLLRPLYNVLRCFSTVLRLTLNKARIHWEYTENTLRTGEDIWRFDFNSPRINYGWGENECDLWRIFHNKGRTSWEQGRIFGEFTENKKVVRFAGECPTTELRWRRICYQ